MGDVKSQTSAPFCKVCEHYHSGRDPHIWDGEPKTKKEVVYTLRKKAETIIKKRVHNPEKPKDVCTQYRKVNIRQLRTNMAKELLDLPFDIIRNGKVIARVEKVGE